MKSRSVAYCLLTTKSRHTRKLTNTNCTASNAIFHLRRFSVKPRKAVVTGTALYILPGSMALIMNTTTNKAARKSTPLLVNRAVAGASSSVSMEPLQTYMSAAASTNDSTICTEVSATVMPNMLRGMAP